MKNITKSTWFLLLTFMISFSLAGIYKLAGIPADNRMAFVALGALYMFVPALVVFIVKKGMFKESVVSDLWVSLKLNKWFLVAWLLMPVLIFCALGVSILILPDVVYSTEIFGLINDAATHPSSSGNMILLAIMQGLVAGVTINALAGLGEELGWRGLLLHEWQGMSFLKASFLIGTVWGLWHAPLILMGHNYPKHPEAGVAMMVGLCILLSPLLIYITIKARSVIAAAIMHGTMNALAGLSIVLVKGGNDLTVGMTGLSGFVVLALTIGVLFVYDQYISKDKILTSTISQSLSRESTAS
jgi:membrane protease YdiL (CAAX protease family)